MPTFSRFLRYFMAVGRLGSIRKAADELNVSASAIDRQILNAEAEFGMPLFERLSTGLRLTAAGEIIMAAGGNWQKGLREMRAQMEDLRGLKRGHVDIAVIDALTKGYIPSTIQAIQSRYPGITIGVKVMSNEAIRGAIVAGKVDFGICFSPESYRDLTVLAFAEVHLGFVTPPGHPLANQSSARFSACSGLSMVLPAPPLAVAQQVRVMAGATKAPMVTQVDSDNIQMISSLVQGGVGIGILSSLDVATEVHAGQLAFVPLSDPILKPMILALCTATSRTTSYAADIVLSEIQSGFAQLGSDALWPAQFNQKTR